MIFLCLASSACMNCGSHEDELLTSLAMGARLSNGANFFLSWSTVMYVLRLCFPGLLPVTEHDGVPEQDGTPQPEDVD